ncbi:MAG TPA: hypothetical protein VK465_15330, partial [Fibrobacteria bacterium]|nr:hypothetical protein [Fibrobacteria bacterium]
TLGTDVEEATVTFVSSAATRGTWEGSVPLRDRAITASGNDTLETYFRGELSASIVPHNNGGIRGGGAVTDELVIAYPDQPAEIVIRDTAGTEVGRPTTRISVTVKDQPHTLDGAGAITVNVVCEGSNDRIQNLRLVWDGTAYVAVPPVVKGEGNSGSPSDSVLTCRTSDRITVTYTDPVYGDTRAGEARWSDQKAARVYFASTRDSSTITSVVDGVDKDFLVIVEGVSPTRDKADTVVVILTTSQRPGDTLRVRTVETGLLTGRFVARAPFGFIPGKPNASNGELEAGINQEERSNRVVAAGEAQLPDSKPTGDIALFAAYNMVVLAYMKDMDGNGRADRAIFAFDKRLAHLPDSLPEVAWNEEGEAFRKQAPRSRLSFAGPDSNVVVADFSADEFAQGLTGIPSGRRPHARFPADNLFGGQDQALADSVGPVPIEAVKLPSNMTSYYVTPTEKRFYPDTINLRVSEELRTTTVWMSMVRFSKGCVGYEQSTPLRLYQEPIRSSADPLEWSLIVDNSPAAQIPLVGDCIYLETDGHYTDLNGNRPGILGAVITGENPRLVIRDFRGYPPVAGLDASKPAFVTGNSDRRDKSSSHWSTETSPGSWEVVWIPPAGFETENPVGSVGKMVPAGLDPKSPLKQDIEVQSPQTMPTNISAVQVIATGRYIARISIFDNFGNIVRNMTQAFGFWGEEKNPWRATDKGLRSFLIWDLKDKNQQLVGQGVFVWKVHFTFLDKKSEIMYTRTGVLRP